MEIVTNIVNAGRASAAPKNSILAARFEKLVKENSVFRQQITRCEVLRDKALKERDNAVKDKEIAEKCLELVNTDLAAAKSKIDDLTKKVDELKSALADAKANKNKKDKKTEQTAEQANLVDGLVSSKSLMTATEV